MSASKTDTGKSSDNVQVAIRCRPMNPDEVEARHGIVVKVDNMRGTVTMTPANGSHRSGSKERTFTFDTVFGFDSKQVDVYNETARPIVDSVLEGYNGRIGMWWEMEEGGGGGRKRGGAGGRKGKATWKRRVYREKVWDVKAKIVGKLDLSTLPLHLSPPRHHICLRSDRDW